MTKIHSVVDTLTFRDANKSQLVLIKRDYERFRAEFINRYTEIEHRIGSTEDPDLLQKLDSTQKFYKSTASLIDFMMNLIEFQANNFDNIDESYWNFAIHGQKMQDENRFLKHTVENMTKQRDLVMEGWRSERRKWNEGRILRRVS